MYIIIGPTSAIPIKYNDNEQSQHCKIFLIHLQFICWFIIDKKKFCAKTLKTWGTHLRRGVPIYKVLA